MKLLNITALGFSVFALSLFTSCIDDETHEADTEVNVVEFEGIESVYTAIAHENSKAPSMEMTIATTDIYGLVQRKWAKRPSPPLSEQRRISISWSISNLTLTP